MRGKHLSLFAAILALAFPPLSCRSEEAANRQANRSESVAPADAHSGARVLLQASAVSTSTIQRASSLKGERAAERREMVERQIAGRGVKDAATLRALLRVERHKFTPPDQRAAAYEDRPLPIGYGQTISQPYIVGVMTEMLALTTDSRVLEVGTGSAYQAAVLGEIAREAVTIEILEPLARPAAERLERLGYRNITVLHGDGYFGWPPGAPYDAILVTAAAEHNPPPLLDQHQPGGRMMNPVGPAGWTQNLILVEKGHDGSVRTRSLMAVSFEPLTRRLN